MLASIIQGEVCFEDFILVADKISHNFTIDCINEPDHIVFTTCHQNRRLCMPFNKVEILLRNLVQSLLQCESVLHVPDTKLIIHSTCAEPFTTGIKLAELNCFSVSRQLTNQLHSEWRRRLRVLFSFFVVFHRDLFCFFLLFSLLVWLFLGALCSLCNPPNVCFIITVATCNQVKGGDRQTINGID